jgi:multiple antibiotic resistance protein
MLADHRQYIETVALAAVALLPIVNPLGGAPIYLAKTIDLSAAQHGELAKRVALNCALLLLASLLLGTYVLDFFGLSVPVVQVAGGLLVCSIAWSLLNAPDQPPPVQDEARHVSPDGLRERAFYPLTLPITVGPGSISVAIALGADQSTGMRSALIVGIGHITAVAIVAAAVYVCYRYADRILRRLGDTGTVVLLRLSAFILLCIGVQILWNGVAALLASRVAH